MRQLGWEKKLDTVIRKASRNAFQWGTNDCALFTADAMLAVLGEDLGVFFRDKYTDEEGAKAALQEFAQGGLEQTIDKLAAGRFAKVHGNFAQRGDVVLVNINPTNDAVYPAGGVVGLNGKEVLVVSEKGLLTFHRKRIIAAWRMD